MSTTAHHRPYPWPWGQPSILVSTAEDHRRQANIWLDADIEDQNSSDSDYAPSDGSDSEEEASDESASAISDSELADINADAQVGWPIFSASEKELDDEDAFARQIAELVKAEQDAAAAYNPDEVASLLTEFVELFVTMGHFPEGSIQYPPHTDPPVNEELATRLGYTPAVISLMRRLPYVHSAERGWTETLIVDRTPLANYTREDSLREGRHPYPYEYLNGGTDLDPWLLPLVLPNRDGWNILLDTELGVIRAYSTGGYVPQDTVEWRRYGKVPDDDETAWTDYRRAPLVPAARYLSEVIHAYRSLSRLPVIDVEYNDPMDNRHYPSKYEWIEIKVSSLSLTPRPIPIVLQEREEKQAILALYHDCGWPDQWRRADFLAKWLVKKEEISGRIRELMEAS
jgi:hypothetical protein